MGHDNGGGTSSSDATPRNHRKRLPPPRRVARCDIACYDDAAGTAATEPTTKSNRRTGHIDPASGDSRPIAIARSGIAIRPHEAGEDGHHRPRRTSSIVISLVVDLCESSGGRWRWRWEEIATRSILRCVFRGRMETTTPARELRHRRRRRRWWKLYRIRRDVSR